MGYNKQSFPGEKPNFGLKLNKLFSSYITEYGPDFITMVISDSILYTNNLSNNKGQIMYDLWSTNGMCPPTLMQAKTWYNPFLLTSTRYTNNVFRVDFHCRPGTDYTIEYTDTLNPPLTWHEFQNNGTKPATGDTIFFEDDFTSNTSTNVPPANGMRFYRFRYE